VIDGLKPYPEYKKSDIPWARVLPSNWQTERAKRLFTKMQRPVRPEDEVVTCFRDGRVTLRKNRRLRGFTEATAFSGYQGIRKGDLVIHGMDAFAGAIGVSDSDGKGTPVYNVCKPNLCIVAGYYAHTIREMSRAQWILALAKGIRERSTDFRYETFGNQFVPLPPPDEQAAIVRFLEHANGKIERAIRAKKKLIALLNEQKQAIIHRAVTRGLNPNAALKPSGIPWLGDIPKHWETRPLKQLLVRMDYGTSENARGEGRIRVLGMGHIRGGKVFLPEKGSLDTVPPGLDLQKNDLLFNRTNSPDLVGKVGLFEHDTSEEITFASYLVRLRIRAEHNPSWLNFLLNSVGFWGYARSQALVSLHQANLSSSRYARMTLPVPSTRSEQDAIADAINTNSKPIYMAIARSEREIALLLEYRTRLTADVVTGKLDVRAAAANLPDVPLHSTAEPEVIDSPEEFEAEEIEA
jgi:type I restriction enzyme S subunit